MARRSHDRRRLLTPSGPALAGPEALGALLSEEALDAIHEYVKSVTTNAEARSDGDLLADAKAASITHAWCREVAPRMHGECALGDHAGRARR